MKYHIVQYSGSFGFIKPWSAVRDGETFSQQFLTPSIAAGLERKLFPELLSQPWGIYTVLGHRLAYDQMSEQQEQIQPRGWNRKGKSWERPRAVIKRNVLVNPRLFLAFSSAAFAERAFQQHICLCRNEDLLFPTNYYEVDADVFNADESRFAGFELVFGPGEDAFMVGHNRFEHGQPMFGSLRVVGQPVKAF